MKSRFTKLEFTNHASHDTANLWSQFEYVSNSGRIQQLVLLNKKHAEKLG